MPWYEPDAGSGPAGAGLLIIQRSWKSFCPAPARVGVPPPVPPTYGMARLQVSHILAISQKLDDACRVDAHLRRGRRAAVPGVMGPGKASVTPDAHEKNDPSTAVLGPLVLGDMIPTDGGTEA